MRNASPSKRLSRAYCGIEIANRTGGELNRAQPARRGQGGRAPPVSLWGMSRGQSVDIATKAAGLALAGVVGYDLLQRRRAVLRNFPLVGHFRYALEAFGPELRQYIVTSNNEERPFSRDQRRWIDASAEAQPNVFGFGTDDEMEAVESSLIFKHSPFPAPAPGEGQPGGPPGFEIPARRCWAPRTTAPAPSAGVHREHLRA